MKILIRNILFAMSITAGLASAELRDAGPGGFTTVHDVVIAETRNTVWKTSINEVGRWWSPDHTLSGNAAWLSINSELQGCFCERFETGGGVVHMTVTMVNPGVVIRFTGALGPLGLMGAEGNMTWEFDDVDGGTRVKFTYAVGGYLAAGLDTLAGPVDSVIGEALDRLKAHVESSDANSVDIE